MATIGITGSFGGLNTGDEAILASELAALRARRPDDQLVVFTRDAEHTRAHHDADDVVASRDTSRDDVAPHVDRLSLLLVGGGGILYDTEARHYLRDARLAQERGIPVATFAVGAGPLHDPDDRALVRDVVGAMDVVTVRDEGAKRVLEDVGVEQHVEVTADPALLLEAAPFTDDMLAREGLESSRPIVGLSVREPGKAAEDLDEDDYHALLAHAADFAVHRFDADVVFVPMERGDIQHSHAVIGKMVAADRAHVLKGSYAPGEVLGLMRHLDLVVGMRLHLLIFAALAGVAFLPLPYAPKVFSFVEALGLVAPPPVKRESVGPLLAAIDELWDQRARRSEHLAEAVEPLRAAAKRTLDLALAPLEGPSERPLRTVGA